MDVRKHQLAATLTHSRFTAFARLNVDAMGLGGFVFVHALVIEAVAELPVVRDRIFLVSKTGELFLAKAVNEFGDLLTLAHDGSSRRLGGRVKI